MADFSKAAAYVRAHGARIGLEALANFIGPFLIYQLEHERLGDVRALLAASIPPIAWSVIEFARRRRLDAASILVLAGIALSLLAYLGGGSVRFLQLREKLVTALIGLAFLGSAAIGKPLIYELARATARRRSAAEAQSLEAMRDNADFRRAMNLMTLVWGVGLIAEATLAAVLVFVLPISAFLLVSPLIGYGAMGALALWTFLYVRHRRRVAAEREAAAAAPASEDAPAPLA